MEGHEEQGAEQQGVECEMDGPEKQGVERIDIEGNQHMGMHNDDGKHETENNGAEATDGHKTGDSTTLGSRRRSRRRSHTIMPPLVPDSVDEKTVIKPTSDR
jgi:hypothetical protein